MSVTLFCVVKGSSASQAFEVVIENDKSVSALKEVIKAKKAPEFDGFAADKLRLWKVTIPDDQDDLLSNLSLQDDAELLATKKISKYFPNSPAEEHIHVIVEPLVSITTSNHEQELLDRIASLQALLNKSVYEFDVVVSPKRTKGSKWTVNIEHATLEGLKDFIRGMYQPPALESDGAVLNFMNDGDRYLPRNDASFREMLQSLVTKKDLKFTVFIETPSKPFNKWTFPKVCELYGLSNDPNPSIKVFPVFSCGCVDLKDEKSQVVVRHLMTGLKLLQDITPLDMAYEATKSIYSYCYLIAGVSFYKNNFNIIPEKLVEGRNGQGNLDYAIECRLTNRIVGLVEVKRDDFMKGFAQASVQMESSLTGRKRKADEIDNDQYVDKVFGIVTDARDWYFMECTLDEDEKPTFKLSEPVTVVYNDENMQTKVEKVLGYIAWLLEEAKKPVEASQSVEQSRVIKKHKSSSNLTEE